MRYEEIVRIQNLLKKYSDLYKIQLAKLYAMVGELDKAKEIVQELLEEDESDCIKCKSIRIENFIALLDELEKKLKEW